MKSQFPVSGKGSMMFKQKERGCACAEVSKALSEC